MGPPFLLARTSARVAVRGGCDHVRVNVADRMNEAAHDLLPLRVRSIETNDPVLVLIGDDWHIAITCSWKWRRTDGSQVEDGDSGAEDAVWDLCGVDVSAFGVPDSSDVGLVLRLGDGSVLEVVPDHGWDPWVFNHAALEVTFVGQAG